MTRLPAPLQPLWPIAKQVHRRSARAIGTVSRRTSFGDAPREATATSRETAARFPATARFHSAGEAIPLSRPMPAGSPPDHWVFGEALRHEVPERFVLDLDDGTAVGPHVGVITDEGVLDNETSHYFGIRDWREHPIFLNPLPSTGERFDGTLLVLASRATGHNYFHFLMDSLPRLGMLDQAMPGVRPDGYLIDQHGRYHRELAAMLGLDALPLLQPRRGVAVTARRLLVPSLPNISCIISPETTAWLREALPATSHEGLPERLYVTRGQTKGTRRMDHEDEVFARLARQGFVRFDPGTASIQDQIDHFAAARVIVAPHGAALTNLTFCRPGVRVLEMFAPGYLNASYWSIASNVEEARYRYLVATTPRAPRPGSKLLGVMNDITVTPEQVEASLEDLLGDAA